MRRGVSIVDDELRGDVRPGRVPVVAHLASLRTTESSGKMEMTMGMTLTTARNSIDKSSSEMRLFTSAMSFFMSKQRMTRTTPIVVVDPIRSRASAGSRTSAQGGCAARAGSPAASTTPGTPTHPRAASAASARDPRRRTRLPSQT
eukprot:5046359-Prymnesium_polylepis.2